MINLVIFIVQIVTVCVIIMRVNKSHSKRMNKLEEESSIVLSIIQRINNGADKMSEEVNKFGLRDIIDADSSTESHVAYTKLLLEKVKDRFDKAFFKYYRALDTEEPSSDNVYLIQMVIEPEDLSHFLKMNRAFIVNNLDNETVNRLFVNLIGEYIDLEGVKVLRTYNDEIPLTHVTSIARDSSVIVHIAFVRDEDYEQVQKDIDSKLSSKNETN